jgi:O-antigen/teichoic acid export membrane protein
VTRLLHKDRIAASISLVFSLLIAQKIVAFGRGIIFARLLGTEQYGIFTLGFFFVLITVSIAGLGITAAFGRYAPRYEGMGALRWFIRKAYALNISLALVLGVIVFLFPSAFSRLLYGEPGQAIVLMFAALAIPGMVVVRNLVTTFAGLKLFRASSILEFSQVAIFALLGGLLVVVYRSASVGLLAYGISMILCIPLFAPLLAGYLRTQEPVYKEADEVGFYKRLLRFTMWFTITPILGQVFNYVDRLSLQRLMTSSDQGIYSAAINLSATISAVGLAVNSVIYPHLSTAWEGGKREGALKNLDLSIRVTAVGLLAIGLVLVLLAKPIIVLLLGQDYVAGAQVLPWIVVFHILTISLWLFGVFPTLVERTYVSAIGIVCALPVNVLLNLLLIPRWGIVGAAVATVVSYLVMWFITVRICAAYGMPVKRRTVIVSFLPFALLLPKLLAVAGVGLVLYICAAKTWIVTRDERQRVYRELAVFIKRNRAKSEE